jgi:hypothetical protein
MLKVYTLPLPTFEDGSSIWQVQKGAHLNCVGPAARASRHQIEWLRSTGGQPIKAPRYVALDKTYLYGECFLGFFCVKLGSKSLNFSC